MKLKSKLKRFLSLLLLFSLLLSTFPLPAYATEEDSPTLTEEKPSVKAAGKNYTTDLNNLPTPIAAYSTHYNKIKDIPSGARGTVDVGDYVMLVQITENNKVNAYAMAPGALTATYNTAIPSVSVTINSDGNYLTFNSEQDLRNATVTLKANTISDYSYERLMLRQDGKSVEAINYNDTPTFHLRNPNNGTFGFYYQVGKDGMTMFKGIQLSGDSQKLSYYVGYQNGSFILAKDPNLAKHIESTKVYFYQMTTITQNLYNALQAAKAYATGNGNGKYDPELYAGFIALLEDCITQYNLYNHYLSTAELQEVSDYQKILDSRADSLNAYMQVLAAAGNNSGNYSTAVGKLAPSLGWDNGLVKSFGSNYPIFDGSYFVVYKNSADNKYYLMDPSKSRTDGKITATTVTVSNNKVTNATKAQAIDLVYEIPESGGVSAWNTHYFRMDDGNYLRAELNGSTPLITKGHAHQSMGLRVGNDGNSFAIYRNINAALNGMSSVNSADVRLNFDTTNKNNFYLKLTTTNTDFYQLYRLTWSTEALRAAIVEMADYTKNKGSGAISAVYEDFLTCLEESIAMYHKYNVSHTQEQFDQATDIQAKLKSQVTRLLSYKDLLSDSNYAAVISKLPTPYNEVMKDPISRQHGLSMQILMGSTVYMVQENPTTGTALALVPNDELYDAYVMPAVPATVENGRVINGQTLWAYKINPSITGQGVLYKNEIKPNPINNMNFQVGDGLDLANNTNGTYLSFYGSTQTSFGVVVYNGGLLLYVSRDFDNDGVRHNYAVTYESSYGGFLPKLNDHHTPGDNNLIRLYRVSAHVMELYDAITRMAVYGEVDSASRYPAGEYNRFLTCLQESIALYQRYNTSLLPDESEENLKSILDAQAETLLGYIQTLTLSDQKASYIDIPVEILDFRADGFMFEYNDGVFGMSTAVNVEDHYGLKYGTLKAASSKTYTYHMSDGTAITNSVAQNLTESTLVKGYPVYTEKTLKQVAYGIVSGIATQFDNIPGQNNHIMTKASALAKSAEGLAYESAALKKILGSPEATFNKTATGQNGGDLLWKNVITAYDLAYYILTYLWRPVSDADPMGTDGYTYNVTVPERSVIRMYRKETPKGNLYVLDSYDWVEYGDQYIYNAYPSAETNSHRASPNFTPIDALGFEKNGVMPGNADTDRSDYLYETQNLSSKGANFHFTVHAKGSFVYSEEQNLYFEFLGDDDVYFFINDQIAMDLGGGHQAAGHIMYLNDKAKSLGLVDGEIYSFDMFYAERKTSASNLRFMTNMQLMDPNLITKKSQANAEGESLVDGAVVNEGDTIFYSFEMENHNDLPVVDLSFSDPTLGIYMSKDNVTVDPALSETEITNITLTYRSINRNTGELYNGTNISYHKDYSYFKNKLQGHVNDTDNPQPHLGHYTYTVKSAKELKAILDIGIPANFLLTVSGMVRKAQEGKYVNTLTTSACPVTLDAAGAIIPLTPVYGSASRNIYGIDLGEITIPEAMQLVLDYGKPLALPMNELWTRVDILDSNILLDYVGISPKGSNITNGTIRKSRPLNLLCTTAEDPYTMDCGILSLEEGCPVFRLTKQMTHGEQFYTVHSLTMKTTGEIFGYVFQEVQLLPATVMYYETNFTDDFVSIQHVKENGTKETVTTTKWDSDSAMTATEEMQDNDPVVPGDAFVKTASEEKDYTGALFFDFSNTQADANWYSKQDQYAGVNYDLSESWLLQHSQTDISSENIIDIQAGTLSFNAIKTFPKEGSTSTANRLDLCNAVDLAYDPARAEILQVRFKLENMRAGQSQPFFRLWWWGYKDGMRYLGYENAQYFSKTYTSDGTYMVYTLDLRSIKDTDLTDGDYHYTESGNGFIDLRELDTITDFRFSLHNFAVSPSSVITYDYLYIGPKNNAPVQHGGKSLYFTFDNTDSDLMRYRYPQYNGLNPDTAIWKGHQWLSADAAGNTNGQTTQITPTIDHINGTMYLQARKTVTAGVQSNLAFKLENLNYPVANAEILQLRIKTEGLIYYPGDKFTEESGEAADDKTRGKIDFRYRTQGDTSDQYCKPYYYPSKSKVEGDSFFIVEFTLDDAFRKLPNLNYLRITLENFGFTPETKITIDYIYIGPKADAPYITKERENAYYSNVKDDFLYFGYENSEDAAARYSSAVYKGINFDQMTDGTQTCWMARTVQANPSLTMDNAAGTLTVTANADPFNPTASSNGDRFYFQTGVCDATTQPLNYSLSNADIAQVRLKFKGFTQRNNGQTPLLEFRAHTDGYVYNGSADYCTVALSYTIPLDVRYLDAEEYITFSAPVLPEIAKYARLNTLRLDFLYFDWAEGANVGTVTIDYIYVGPADSAPDPVYGYDSSYENDTMYSNHSSLYVEGTGVKLPDRYDENGKLIYTHTGPYTVGEFSFTGTGFDIIATTGIQGANLRVELYDKSDNLLKQMTVYTKGELELYQIPVVSVQGLDFGDYHVIIYVNYGLTTGMDMLNRGNQFYFDAVRIYDPVDTTKTNLTKDELDNVVAHLMDHEDRSHIKEIRNILLTAEKFSQLSGSDIGALFMDAQKVTDSQTPEDYHLAMDIQTYNKVGPKNEVYLDPGQAVAFRLEIDSSTHPINTLIPISLDIGAKTITGKTSTLVAAVVSATSTTDSALSITTKTTVELSTATAMYRPLNLNRSMLQKEGSKYYCYIVLYNNTSKEHMDKDTDKKPGDYVISLTDVKLCYVLDPNVSEVDSPTDPEIDPDLKAPITTQEAQQVNFMVDGNTVKAAAKVISACLETPVLDEGTKLLHSLDLASDISINYVVAKSDLEGYDTFYLDCLMEGEETSVQLQATEKGNYYYFTLTGLTAVQMTEKITATLRMEKQGRYYYSETDTYSIAQYAYSQLSNGGASPSLKQLCADLLRYGTAAQLYKGYRTYDLPESKLTEEHRAYLSDLSALTFGNTNQQLKDVENPSVTWAGKALDLNSKVALIFAFDASAYAGSVDALRMKLSYTDLKGQAQVQWVEAPKAYGEKPELYAFTFHDLLAAELRTVVTVQIYEGNTPVSPTLQYSPDTYGNNKTGDLLELCKALFAYSDSAKAYFTN